MQKHAPALLAALALLSGETLAAPWIQVEIGKSVYAFELIENDAARAFADRLPIRVRFEDYGSTERIAYLEPPLDIGTALARTKPERGDITYYAPWGNLAVFLQPFRTSEGLVALGKLPQEALQAIESSGNSIVTFRQMEKKE